MTKFKLADRPNPTHVAVVAPHEGSWMVVGPVYRFTITKASGRKVAVMRRASGAAALARAMAPRRGAGRINRFESDLDYLLEKNAELYQRLAR